VIVSNNDFIMLLRARNEELWSINKE
jgi:hypothetical protein